MYKNKTPRRYAGLFLAEKEGFEPNPQARKYSTFRLPCDFRVISGSCLIYAANKTVKVVVNHSLIVSFLVGSRVSVDRFHDIIR